MQISWLQIHFPFCHSGGRCFHSRSRRKTGSTGTGISLLDSIPWAPNSSPPLPLYSDPHSWTHWSFHLEALAQFGSQSNPYTGPGSMPALSPVPWGITHRLPLRSGNPRRATGEAVMLPDPNSSQASYTHPVLGAGLLPWFLPLSPARRPAYSLSLFQNWGPGLNETLSYLSVPPTAGTQDGPRCMPAGWMSPSALPCSCQLFPLELAPCPSDGFGH